MTWQQEPTEPQRDKLTEGGRKFLEIAGWVVSPVLLIAASALVALILDAPWLRAASVFAILAIGAGIYLFNRPRNWLPVGKVRSAGLMYAGVGALTLAAAFSSAGSPQSQTTRAADAQSATNAAENFRPPPPERRTLYPWVYTAPQLTLRCENSTSHGVGEIVATTDDERTFAVSTNAVSSERPSIEAIQKSGVAGDELIAGVAGVANAGRRLCQGPERAGLSLIATPGTPPPPPPPPPSPWSYTSSIDEMSDQRTSHACTRSTNMVQLGFPYETQRVSLCLRQHPRWGQDVIVRLERGGQFLCTSYQACTVRIRFDDGEAAAYSALEPSDNSSDTIFISNDARFIANARRSSRVIIEANFYQAGAQRMSFDTDQLQWPPG